MKPIGDWQHEVTAAEVALVKETVARFRANGHAGEPETIRNVVDSVLSRVNQEGEVLADHRAALTQAVQWYWDQPAE